MLRPRKELVMGRKHLSPEQETHHSSNRLFTQPVLHVVPRQAAG